jgi:hypothetical protein
VSKLLVGGQRTNVLQFTVFQLTPLFKFRAKFKFTSSCGVNTPALTYNCITAPYATLPKLTCSLICYLGVFTAYHFHNVQASSFLMSGGPQHLNPYHIKAYFAGAQALELRHIAQCPIYLRHFLWPRLWIFKPVAKQLECPWILTNNAEWEGTCVTARRPRSFVCTLRLRH